MRGDDIGVAIWATVGAVALLDLRLFRVHCRLGLRPCFVHSPLPRLRCKTSLATFVLKLNDALILGPCQEPVARATALGSPARRLLSMASAVRVISNGPHRGHWNSTLSRLVSWPFARSVPHTGQDLCVMKSSDPRHIQARSCQSAAMPWRAMKSAQ